MELDKDKKIPFDVHYRDHIWADKQQELQDKKDEMWAKFWMDVGKSLLISVIGIIGWLVLFGGEAKIKEIITEVQVESRVSK